MINWVRQELYVELNRNRLSPPLMPLNSHPLVKAYFSIREYLASQNDGRIEALCIPRSIPWFRFIFYMWMGDVSVDWYNTRFTSRNNDTSDDLSKIMHNSQQDNFNLGQYVKYYLDQTALLHISDEFERNPRFITGLQF